MSTAHMAYPEYRDTRIEWLKKIPAHWEITPLKHLCSFTGGGTPSKDNLRFWLGGTVPWVSPKDMKVFRVSDTQDYLTEEAVDGSSTNFVEPGAVLLVVRSGILQRTIPVAINDVRVTLNQDMKALSFSAEGMAEYFAYLIRGNTPALRKQWLKEGATVESIEHELLANALVPNVSEQERKPIVAFLDYETTKIDALIEKQQQLIALLKEKRQAVISHAVTKGLNPEVPMRESGVEWLGDVPAHWTVCAMKRDARVQGGYAFKSDDFGEEGEPVVRIGDIKLNGSVGVDGCKRVPELVASPLGVFVVEPGDIVMAMTGATIGKAGKIPEGEAALLNQRVGAFRLASGRLVYGFLWFILGSEGYLEHVRLTADGGAQPNISDAGMLAYQVALPPTDEQVTIVEYLERTLPAFDKLVEQTKAAVDILQERRTALISAAVTGKIDVRDWKPPESETEEELP